MTPLVALMVLASVIALVTGGYLFGARKGRAARAELLTAHQAQEATVESLRAELAAQQAELAAQQAELAALQTQKATIASLKAEQEATIASLKAAQEATIASLKAELAGRPAELREELDRALRPLVDRDRVGDALAEIAPGKSLADLPRLLDAICARAKLAAVVLGDEVGLPLGASSSATGIEVLAGVSSLVLTLADRSAESGGRPLAVLVHDDANRRILHRIFSVGESRFVLTAVARGRELSADALEPAVDKLEALLGRRAA